MPSQAQMLSPHLLCFYKRPPLPPPLFPALSRQVHLHSDDDYKFMERNRNPISFSTSPSCFVVHAVKEDSQQYEVDPDKAREALRELDQQLQSLSNKQVSSPKIRASDVKLTKEQVSGGREEGVEISGSVLAYSAFALFLFTIFYNVLFYTVIKPSIDGS